MFSRIISLISKTIIECATLICRPILANIQHCKVYNVHSIDHAEQCLHYIQCFANNFQHLLRLVNLVVALHVHLGFLFMDWTSFWGHLLAKQNRKSSTESSSPLGVLMKKHHLVNFSHSSNAFRVVERSLSMGTNQKRGSRFEIMNCFSARSWLRWRSIFWFLHRSSKLVDDHFLNERCIVFFTFLIFPRFILLFEFLFFSFSNFFYLFLLRMNFCFKLGQFRNE